MSALDILPPPEKVYERLPARDVAFCGPDCGIRYIVCMRLGVRSPVVVPGKCNECGVEVRRDSQAQD